MALTQPEMSCRRNRSPKTVISNQNQTTNMNIAKASARKLRKVKPSEKIASRDSSGFAGRLKLPARNLIQSGQLASSLFEKVASSSKRPLYECGVSQSRYWLAGVEIAQDGKARTGRCKMLHRMAAQDEAHRVDCMVVELEQLGERIRDCGDEPVGRTGISRRKRNEQYR